MIDQFYTPPELARFLVGCLPDSFTPGVIADFAAGEGSLLRAASRRWPEAQALANDLSPATVRLLKAEHPNWIVSNSDFLLDRSVRSSALESWAGRVDLVLLNPPFSQRRRTPHQVVYKGETIGVSLAMAFVLKSLAFAHDGSYVLAVLPDGCLVSKRDEKIWLKLKSDFHVEILRDNANSTFDGVRARTSLVSISGIRVPRMPLSLKDGFAVSGPSCVVKRGQQQMHSLLPSRAAAAVPLVHTTHLVAGQVIKSGPRIVPKSHVCGPALLLPRVGRITTEKVCVLEPGDVVAISDCVLAIEKISAEEVRELRRAILENWTVLTDSYRGTGAPHITLERASLALSRIMSADSAGGSEWKSSNSEGEFHEPASGPASVIAFGERSQSRSPVRLSMVESNRARSSAARNRSR